MIYRAELLPHPCLPLQCKKDCWGPISHPVGRERSGGKREWPFPSSFSELGKPMHLSRGARRASASPRCCSFPLIFQELPHQSQILAPRASQANKTSEGWAGGTGRKPTHVGAESRSCCSLPVSQGAGRHQGDGWS